MRYNKKGDLSLSINAIVILILAITMLGLGLAFMRNIFGKATTEFQEIGGTVKKQMMDQMKNSDKTVDLSRPKVEIKAGETTQVFIGFNNNGNYEKRFMIDMAQAKPPTSLAGYSNTNCNWSAPSNVYLEYKTANTSVIKGDVVVLPINIRTASNTNPDTCFFEIPVYYTDSYNGGTTTDTEIIELSVDITS